MGASTPTVFHRNAPWSLMPPRPYLPVSDSITPTDSGSWLISGWAPSWGGTWTFWECTRLKRVFRYESGVHRNWTAIPFCKSGSTRPNSLENVCWIYSFTPHAKVLVLRPIFLPHFAPEDKFLLPLVWDIRIGVVLVKCRPIHVQLTIIPSVIKIRQLTPNTNLNSLTESPCNLRS